MKISQLSAEALQETLDKVELELNQAPRPTKALVIKVLSDVGLCSRKSTGTEQTLLKAVQAANIPIPPKFAALMGVEASAPASETLPVPPTNPTQQRGSRLERLSNHPLRLNLLGAVSVVATRGGNGTVFFTDGSQEPIGNLDESELASSYNLLELSASQS